MARVCTRNGKSKKIERNLKQLYEEALSNTEDKDILCQKIDELTNGMIKLSELLFKFSKTLVTYNVPIDDSLVNFALLLHQQKYDTYESIKQSTVYLQIMETCVLFKNIFDNFELKSKSDEIIIPVFSWSESFNFKHIYMYAEPKDEGIKNIEILLREINDVLKIFVEEAFEPAINIKKLTTLVNEAFDVMQLKLPRCEEAFKILRSSLLILEKNYKDYHKESVLTGNTMSFITSYETAISNNPDLITTRKSKAVLQMQFKKILGMLNDSLLQKMNNVNPELKQIISVLLDQSSE